MLTYFIKVVSPFSLWIRDSIVRALSFVLYQDLIPYHRVYRCLSWHPSGDLVYDLGVWNDFFTVFTSH